MLSTFDIDKLKIFLKNFYTAVGIRISVFDDEFNMVAEYPEKCPSFCSQVRSTEFGRVDCKNCDINAFKEAKKRKEPFIYVCHAGLTEAVAPIILNGMTLGYVILAHMLPKENYEQSLSEALKRTEGYGLNKNEMLSALKKIKPHTEEKINACVQILIAAAAYLQVKNLVQWKSENIANKIDEFVQNNLDNNITDSIICQKFFVSRTKLYQISKQNFGMTMAKFILFKRIEKAKTLLKENFTVAEVADKTGFSDFNYFGKVFKKEVGLSPSAYKKQNLK